MPGRQDSADQGSLSERTSQDLRSAAPPGTVCIHSQFVFTTLTLYRPEQSPRGKQESSFTVAPCRVNLHCAWRLWSVCTAGNASMESAPCIAQHLAAPSAVRRLARSKTSVLKFAGNSAPQPLPALDLLHSPSAW